MKRTKTRNGGSSAGSLAQIGALVSAILASACCWLPLLLIAFGVSGGALSAKFEALRPALLPVTFILLGAAFYFAYRKPRVAPLVGESGTDEGAEGQACCAVSPGQMGKDNCCPPEKAKGFTIKKLNKVMLWVVTAFVLAFAFFPNYVGALLGGQATPVVRADLDRVAVEIDGMTCEACAVTIQKSLAAVPGVAEAEVSFEKKRAVVGIPQREQVPKDAILKAIRDAGYRGRFMNSGPI